MSGKRNVMTSDIVHQGKVARLARLAVPGIVFTVAFGFAACTGKDPVDQNCPTPGGSGPGGNGGGGSGGTTTSSTTTSSTTTSTTTSTGTGTVTNGNDASGSDDNTFDHENNPGDPFEILQQHLEEGPPEVRGRLHSCQKIPYSSLGEFLKSRGVNMDATAPNGPKPAGQIYKDGKDALGVANYDAREAETYFHTTAGATKLFDIFVQAAPEVIANIQNMPACQVGGVGKPMFDPMTNECIYESLSCIMGRPAKPEDMKLCNTMVQHAQPGNAQDLDIKKRITVAAFLSAAHTCE
ncbi:MAG: hypothetical protein IPK82_08325 [Polyangiaceae bacterium]|nr:hypothetical protein [Polyangiaceae bacterium]